MHYIKVFWLHSHADEPVILYSECDDEGWEQRKIEVWNDGCSGYADETTPDNGGTSLSEVPIPPLDEIAADPQFKPFAIDRDEFEKAWADARTAPPSGS